MADEKAQPQFTKQDFISSTELSGAQHDLLETALVDGRTYTADEAKEAVKQLKGGLF